MHTNSKFPNFANGIVLIGLLIIASVPGFGGNKETIDATAFGTSTQMGSNFTLRIVIYQLSTDKDREMLVQAFQKSQNDGLVQALEKTKTVGRITTPHTLGYDLGYIREVQTPTGRSIRFITNRKIAFGESFGSTQSKSFNLTAGEIRINNKDKGKSEGFLYPAAQLIVNKSGELEFQLRENAWRLHNIHEWK
jgi:hypothetical protein